MYFFTNTTEGHTEYPAFRIIPRNEYIVPDSGWQKQPKPNKKFDRKYRKARKQKRKQKRAAQRKKK